MWLFNKLKMFIQDRKLNKNGVWVEFPLVPVEVKAGIEYILVPKDEYDKLKMTLEDFRATAVR